MDKKNEQNVNNLSVGEIQLVYLAKAEIRKSKIIIIHEATTNKNIKTEDKIQKALQYILDNSTVIIIALIIFYNKLTLN